MKNTYVKINQMYASMKDICTIMKVEKTNQNNLTHGAWSPQDG